VRFIPGGTALCWAVCGGHEKLVTFLIRHRAQIEGTPHFTSPLFLALQRAPSFPSFAKNCNYESIVTLLLEAGADPMKIDNWGRSTLCYATAPGAEEILSFLLNAGVNPNLADNSGQIPLHFASLSFKRTHLIIDTLINAGSNALIQDKDGMTPLHYAARFGRDAEIISLLRAAPSAVEILDGSGTSALAWAISNVHGDLINVLSPLIAAGSDVNGGGGDMGPPLTRAARLGDPKAVRKLVRAGADPNGQWGAYDRPFFLALRLFNFQEKLDIISFLLENGADIRLADSEGKTFREAVQYCAWWDDTPCARTLLELEA
jgi:uncharacterized protein